MEKIETDIFEFIPIEEADIAQYFGKIRNGKTYIATRDAVELLNQGVVVYANWKINWNGYDERESKWKLFWGIVGLKKIFYKFPKENFHYLPLTDEEEWAKIYGTKKFHEIFSKLTDCVVFLDEGHIVFDSYQMTRMPIEQRASILHTGHFNRAIRIISQRPTAIHVTLRANVNYFFKCEKVLDFLGITKFLRSRYEEMTNDESVDLNQEPTEEKNYWGRKKYFEMYDTKYLRGNTPPSQPSYTEVWQLQRSDAYKILKYLYGKLFKRKNRGVEKSD